MPPSRSIAVPPVALAFALTLLSHAAPAAGAACGEDSAGSAIQTHKQNYALALTYDDADPPPARTVDGIDLPDDERQDIEAKFQISFKSRIPGGPAWYLGYTQKSFWQVYDGARSRPFRESNYNPEVFVDWQAPLVARCEWTLRYGLEHESNGQTVDRSRSWNRAYLWPRYETPGLKASLKLWKRFDEPGKELPLDPQGDENRRIVDYLGIFELYGDWEMSESFSVSGMFRRGRLDPAGTLQLSAFTDFGLGWDTWRAMAQFFAGYGESLFDYNHRVRKVGIGVGFR